MTGESRGWVRAFAPASVSNVTCGFDLLGYALEAWGDVVEARATSEPGVRLLEITGDGGRLPIDSRANTAGVAARHLIASAEDAVARAAGVELRLHKGLPLASGLGSSAASGVAAAVAVDAVLGLDADESRLLAAAVEGERIACGTPHPDNAAPCLHGGLLLVRSARVPAVTQLRVPDGLTSVIVHPHTEVATEAARAALPAEVPIAIAIAQAGDLAALVAGLMNDDFELIASAMVDHIAEPVRSTMSPSFEPLRQAARAAGALGCGLSGSGPTVFAWCRSANEADAIAAAMLEALAAEGLEGDSLISPVGAAGARIMPPAGGADTGSPGAAGSA